MNENTNEENTFYLVSIKLMEMVFITKAKDENEAKISTAKYLIDNPIIYGKILSSIEEVPNFLEYFTVIKLSNITKIIENESEGYVLNVARMIQVLNEK